MSTTHRFDPKLDGPVGLTSGTDRVAEPTSRVTLTSEVVTSGQGRVHRDTTAVGTRDPQKEGERKVLDKREV